MPSAHARSTSVMCAEFEAITDLTIAGVNNESCTKELSDVVIFELHLNLGPVYGKFECGGCVGWQPPPVVAEFSVKR